MTYVVDVSLALIRVLDRAAFFKNEQQLSGFAANARFGAGEVRHVLDIIAGYDARLSEWNRAVGPTNDGSSSPVSPDDIAKLTKQLRASATRFFRQCRRYLDRAQVIEIEQLLDISIEHQSMI